ncbi:MAG: hypothetical protein QW041_02690 [Candidatus Pacearchaeota archaeon]
MSNKNLKELEQLVKEVKFIDLNLENIIKKPFDSYDSRHNLDAIVKHEYPIDTAASSYFHDDDIPYMNKYITKVVEKRKNKMKEIIKNNFEDYLNEIDEKSLLELAFSMDEKYRKILSAEGSYEKIISLIREYAAHPDLCIEYIKNSRNPNVLQDTYNAIIEVEKQTIANREGFFSINENEGKIILNRNNVEKYIISMVDKSDANKKNKIYSGIVESYFEK